jgi:hypothetical protein
MSSFLHDSTLLARSNSGGVAFYMFSAICSVFYLLVGVEFSINSMPSSDWVYISKSTLKVTLVTIGAYN